MYERTLGLPYSNNLIDTAESDAEFSYITETRIGCARTSWSLHLDSSFGSVMHMAVWKGKESKCSGEKGEREKFEGAEVMLLFRRKTQKGGARILRLCGSIV